MEVAVHARGQITAGDGLEQLRQLAEVGVADRHHRVQAVDHHPEVVLEALCVAALAEIADRGRGGQPLDLAVDGRQARLGAIHRLVQYRPLAGQAARVLRQIAHRVAVEDGDGVDDGVQVLEHHRVDAARQFAVHAREILRYALRDVLAGVHAGHVLGLVGEPAQHLHHLVGGGEHLAQFVLVAAFDLDRQIAARHRVHRPHHLAQRTGDRTGDGDAQEDRQQHRHAQAHAHRQHGARVGALGGGHLRGQVVHVVLRQRLELVEQFAAQEARLVGGDGLRGLEIIGRHRRGNTVVRREVGGARLLNFFVDRLFLHAGFGRDGAVGRFLGVDQLAGVDQLLLVVGDLVRLALLGQLRLLVGTVLAELGAHFAQVLDRGHPVLIDRAHLRIGRRQPPQRQRAEQDGEDHGDDEGQRQLARDRQVAEPVHCLLLSRRNGARASPGGHAHR